MRGAAAVHEHDDGVGRRAGGQGHPRGAAIAAEIAGAARKSDPKREFREGLAALLEGLSRG